MSIHMRSTWRKPSLFRYEDRSSLPYWNLQVCWERRMLSALGQLVRYYLMCFYNLTEVGLNMLLVRAPDTYKRLEIVPGSNASNSQSSRTSLLHSLKTMSHESGSLRILNAYFMCVLPSSCPCTQITGSVMYHQTSFGSLGPSA